MNPPHSVKLKIFLHVARHRGIQRRQLLGKGYSRLNHHLAGLENQGLIRVLQKGTKGGANRYELTPQGRSLLDLLRSQKLSGVAQ